MVTDATGAGGFTVTAAVPLRPSLVAVIVADPGVALLTSPLPDTVATSVSLLVHLTVRPISALPAASLAIAISCTVSPTTSVDAAGMTVTDATGAGGFTVVGAVPATLTGTGLEVVVPLPSRP
jgi:hypothetical protein